MFCRSLLISTLLVGSALGFAEAAKADTVQVPFSATVDGVCELTNVQPGTLAINASKNKLETDTPGSVDFRCISTTGILTAYTPIQTAGPSDLDAQREVTISTPGLSRNQNYTVNPGNPSASSGTASIPVTDDGEFETATISMGSLRLNGRTFQAGTYSYNVAVTVVPR